MYPRAIVPSALITQAKRFSNSDILSSLQLVAGFFELVI